MRFTDPAEGPIGDLGIGHPLGHRGSQVLGAVPILDFEENVILAMQQPLNFRIGTAAAIDAYNRIFALFFREIQRLARLAR